MIKRFLKKKDFDTIKIDEAIINSQIKRGEIEGTAGHFTHTILGCGARVYTKSQIEASDAKLENKKKTHDFKNIDDMWKCKGL